MILGLIKRILNRIILLVYGQYVNIYIRCSCFLLLLFITHNTNYQVLSNPNRWFRERPIVVLVDREVWKTIPQADYHIDNAFKQWRKQIPKFPPVVIDYGINLKHQLDGLNVITMVDEMPKIKDNLPIDHRIAITLTYSNGYKIENNIIYNNIYEIDIVINKKFRFDIDKKMTGDEDCGPSTCPMDFQTLMLHETGHFFGLNDSNTDDAVMKHSMLYLSTKRNLREEDINKIKLHYSSY